MVSSPCRNCFEPNILCSGLCSTLLMRLNFSLSASRSLGYKAATILKRHIYLYESWIKLHNKRSEYTGTISKTGLVDWPCHKRYTSPQSQPLKFQARAPENLPQRDWLSVWCPLGYAILKVLRRSGRLWGLWKKHFFHRETTGAAINHAKAIGQWSSLSSLKPVLLLSIHTSHNLTFV
jgi:hypothetical protein